MSRRRGENLECKIYVGDLNEYTLKQDVEDAFAYYGRIRNVWVARNPPGFAFVEYEDERDANDAVKEIDGRRVINGRRVRVERAGVRRDKFRFGRGGSSVNRFSRRGNGRPFNSDKCYECGDRGHYARECHRRNRRGSRSGRNRRSYTRSRSNSKRRTTRSESRSYSRRRSYSTSSSSSSSSPKRRSGTNRNKRSYDDKKSFSKSISKSRSSAGTGKTDNAAARN